MERKIGRRNSGEIGAKQGIVLILIWGVDRRRQTLSFMNVESTVHGSPKTIDCGPNQLNTNRLFLQATVLGGNAFKNISVRWHVSLWKYAFDC